MVRLKSTAATAPLALAELQTRIRDAEAEVVAARRADDPASLGVAKKALAAAKEAVSLQREIAEQKEFDAEEDRKRQGYAYMEALGTSGLNGMRECLQLAIATDAKLNEALNGVQAIGAKIDEVGQAICQLDPKSDPAGLKMMLSDCFRQTLINHGFANGLRTLPGDGPTVTGAVQNYVGRVEGILRITLPKLRRQRGISEKSL